MYEGYVCGGSSIIVILMAEFKLRNLRHEQSKVQVITNASHAIRIILNILVYIWFETDRRPCSKAIKQQTNGYFKVESVSRFSDISERNNVLL